MEIKLIQTGTPEYELMLQLRDEVLRRPLGMQLDRNALGKEDADFLICAFEEEAMVGCVILTPLNRTTLKLRQMAVANGLQGRGIGSQIVQWAEAFARSKGYSEITMHARRYAIPFYTSLGYTTEGDEFTEVGIPHFSMRKEIL